MRRGNCLRILVRNSLPYYPLPDKHPFLLELRKRKKRSHTRVRKIEFPMVAWDGILKLTYEHADTNEQYVVLLPIQVLKNAEKKDAPKFAKLN
mmetsp:Transcript_39798/g.85812  ORF Transcript_39798/g.85812 Transcript_39798/m.85812 type:complete len:93 (+) Transcript_39798:1504-1782(+)